MSRNKSTLKVLSNSELFETLKEIEKEVLRVLGRHKSNVETITDVEIFYNYVSACINTGVIAIDTETNNSLDPISCKLMGLCLYAPGMKQAYIPINHRDPITKNRLSKQLTEDIVKKELTRLVDSGITIVMHNGKFDYEVLKCTCDVCVEPHWDTMVATRLLDENENYSLKHQYVSKIDSTQEIYKIDSLFKNIQYADVDPDIFALYSATDAYMTYKLYEYQKQQMNSEPKIFKLFMETEMPLVVIVAEMELCGALVDLNYCEKLKNKYETKLSSIDQELETEVLNIQHLLDDWRVSKKGQEREMIFPSTKDLKTLTQENLERKFPMVNPSNGLKYKYGKTYCEQLKEPIKLSSPKQLAILLYQVLGAPVVNGRKPNGTGKGIIEDIGQLAEIALKYAETDVDSIWLMKQTALKNICKLLTERRKVEKLLTTYLNPIPKLASHWDDGKIRFHLNQLGARTGRFTSGGNWNFYENEVPVVLPGMNAQNLPSENHEIRLIFKAEPGRTFVGGDISQQEPKITAHISMDENMLQVYEEGKDIYASIAQSIYKNNYEDNLEFYDEAKTQINLEGKKRRKTGKVVILATMYGMGKGSVARKLNITLDEAEAMLDAFYGKYAGVRKAIDNSIASCKEYGFVEDVLGRKRRLPNIRLPRYQTKFLGDVTEDGKKAERMIRNFLDNRDTLTKEELSDLVTQAKQYNIVIISNEEYIKKAERQSFNARIQGSAATLTKKIMGMVYRDSLIRKLGGRIVFQIHDELILDCPTEYAEAVRDRLKAIIENSSNSVGIVLPMKCDMTVETRWGEDTMTSELRVAYQELIAEGVENPLDKLCEEFCNFPKESICKIIHNDNEILKFEW